MAVGVSFWGLDNWKNRRGCHFVRGPTDLVVGRTSLGRSSWLSGRRCSIGWAVLVLVLSHYLIEDFLVYSIVFRRRFRCLCWCVAVWDGAFSRRESKRGRIKE